MMPINEKFDDKIWVTTGEQLRTHLKKCHHCWSITKQGQTVMLYDQLESFVFENRTYAFILNTKSIHVSNNDLAHWFCVVIDMKHKIALLHDSLNKLKENHPTVFEYLTRVCESLNLNLQVNGIKTQIEKHLTCGFHALWFVHKSHIHNVYGLLQLKQMMLPYSTEHREKFIIMNTLNIFDIIL